MGSNVFQLSVPDNPLEMTSGAFRIQPQLAHLTPNIFMGIEERCESLATLIARVAEGDHEALASLYDLTRRQIYGLLARILQNAAAAEEVLLDVYTQVWRQAGRFDRKRGSALAWLTTMARSRAIDRLRSGRLEAAHTEKWGELKEVADASNGEGTAAEYELRTLVSSALEKLPQEQREVIELAYFRGMSHGELAAWLGLPLGTVKTRVRLGMLKLREILQPVCERIG